MSKYYYSLLMDTSGKIVINQEVKPRYHTYNMFFKMDGAEQKDHFVLDFAGDETIEMQIDPSCNRSITIEISKEEYERGIELRQRFKSVEKRPQFPIYMSGNFQPDPALETKGCRPLDIFGNVSDDFSSEEIHNFEKEGRQKARTNCVTFSQFVQNTIGVDFSEIDEKLTTVRRASAVNEAMVGLLKECFNRHAQSIVVEPKEFCVHKTANGGAYLLTDDSSDDTRPLSEWKHKIFDAADKIPSNQNGSAFSMDPTPYPPIIMDALNARRRFMGLEEYSATSPC